MRIPKRFKLLGQTIEVVENPRLLPDNGFQGAACYRETKIELLPITEATPAHPSSQEQTFCHELMHFLLRAGGGPVNCHLGGKFLHQNEEFVELMGCLLHQVLTTMEYED